MTDCEKWVWTGIEIPGLQDNSFQRAGKFNIRPTLPAAMGMGGYIPFLVMEREKAMKKRFDFGQRLTAS